ncbi:uncharacterized protein LOC144883440 isoform X2 [Branchiostoma floridae x Branchiostoma japonicum]
MPGTLLRRPLPPKERQQPSVPMISPSPSPDIYRVHTPPHPLRLSPVPSLPSVVPSLASGMHLSQLEAPRDGLQSPVPTIDSKFMVAQKAEKQRSDTAGFFLKQNLLLPYKPRGPDFFPHREPKRPPPVSLKDLFREENFMDKKEPDFTLDDFHIDMSQVPTMPRRELQRAILSKQNYKKMIKMLSEEFSPRQEEVRTTEVRGEDVGVPEFKHRIPQRQLMIEMAAIIGDSMKLLRATMESEDEEEELETRVSSGPLLHQKTHRLVSEYPEADALFNTVTNKYFMGSRRSGSPFEAQGDDDTISPTELAVLDAIVNGGHVLSIKAHFVNQLPDIAPITNTLVYLNLSFNDFHSFPSAVLLLKNLEILKMRNNPINEIPQGIYKLRKLRTFVLSYCMVTSLPLSFYTLTDLQYVDLSYNRISFLPNDVRRLQKLYDLNLEGNQLAAMPCGALKLRRLKHLKVKNNFMHPLLWKENAEKMPQRLIDMCSVVLMKDDLYRRYRNLPVTAQSILDSTDGVCDCCHGPLYGPGIRLIRPCSKIFGIKKLPFLFVACSPHCHNIFMTSTASISKLLYEDD